MVNWLVLFRFMPISWRRAGLPPVTQLALCMHCLGCLVGRLVGLLEGKFSDLCSLAGREDCPLVTQEYLACIAWLEGWLNNKFVSLESFFGWLYWLFNS